MATAKSLGLHEPSALPYLVAESILPWDPPQSLYTWQTSVTHDPENGRDVEEEVLTTERCVVWSRGGVVQRVYNLDVEGEPISQAFTTHFVVSSSRSGTLRHSQHAPNLPGSAPMSQATYASAHQEANISSEAEREVYHHDSQSAPVDLTLNTLERGLVIVLRSQAHVFLLSGDSHVIPLSFEVEAAFPMPFGFILQRKWAANHSGHSDPSVITPISLQSIAAARRVATEGSGGFRSSLVVPEDINPVWTSNVVPTGSMPRTYYFIEILSELGLVVSEKAKSRRDSTWQCTDDPLLSADEQIVYVSAQDELGQSAGAEGPALCLAVTVNAISNTLNLWQLIRRQVSADDSPSRRRKIDSSEDVKRRKSSNVYGRAHGAATPLNRGGVRVRESFGALAQSITENLPHQEVAERKAGKVEDLVTELGAEFQPVGVQTRSARRVSSMLARSDLAMANDRSTFNDLATAQPSRKSLSRSVRRGESIGSFGDRQSIGARRRSSFPATESIISNGTSFLGIPSHSILDDLEAHDDLLGIDGGGVNTMISELPRDVQFAKIKSLPYAANASMRSEHTPKLKVFTLPSPEHVTPSSVETKILSVWIMNNDLRELTIVQLSVSFDSREKTDGNERSHSRQRIKAVDLGRCPGVFDICRICDNSISRMLVLTRTRDGRPILQLEAPWGSPFRVDLPAQFVVFDPYAMNTSGSPDRRRETGSKRTIRNVNISITGLKSLTTQGQFCVIDQEQKAHRVQLCLQPRAPQVGSVLAVCNFVLSGSKNDGLLLAWWEVLRWLRTQDHETNLEWTALVVVIFAIAVPFINHNSGPGSFTHRRKKSSLLRSSSGTGIDLTNWNAMLEQENTGSSGTWRETGGWKWMTTLVKDEALQLKTPPSPTRSRKSAPAVDPEAETKDSSVIHCAALAREFLQSPAGEAAIGPEGYLPTAMNKDRELRRTTLAAILVGLHLAREEQKLNIFDQSVSQSHQHNLVPILAQLGQWLGWKAWTWKDGTYYGDEIGQSSHWLFEDSRITSLEMPGQPFEPPAVFEYLEKCIKEGEPPSFPTLLDVAGYPRIESKTHPLWQSAARLTPRTFALTSFMTQIGRKAKDNVVTQKMLECGINGRVLEALPDGVAAAFYSAMASQRGNPSPSWNQSMVELLDRGDMKNEDKLVYPKSKPHVNPSHEASRDYHSIGNLALESESLHSWDASSEVDRQNIIRLNFRDDRRFQEASKLVNQTRPPVVECNPEPEWSEADLLDAQKELVQFVTRRTLSVAAGRGMMHFDARVPLLTERVPIPAFSLQCVMKSRHGHGTESSQAGMTFSGDKAAFTEDKVCWAFFHNGASAGLMISKDARGINTSWILYNKPPELTNRHAGFLLALGLNGHLKNLAKWVAFKYLTPKHTMTSIGILLGLSASYLGTMDTMITRLLSVHVTRLLPVGAAELNLSGLVQTSGVVGVGLVYWGSGHRRMSEVMLSEIESCEAEEVGGGAGPAAAGAGVEEGVLRDEGYRLAAGFSLGLINLGKGKRLDGLRDMRVLERLLSVAVGTKNVDFVNVLDRATAGSVIAVALVWLKTNDEAVAKKVDIPDTVHQFDYVRPDIFLLRTLARHLILWDRVEATADFVEKSLPGAYRHRASLKLTKYLSTEDMPFFNIVAGICFAIGLRFAGSMDLQVRDLLVSYLDQFIRLTRLPALNYDTKLTRNSVRNCQDVVALATSAVMAGSGDLVVMRRLRSLHGRTDADTPYGSHLAGHMAIGALFLGGGTATFGTSNLSVAALVMSFYPVFPTSVLDNKAHLQALRHMWVLAVERRCVVGREGRGGRAVGVEMKIKMKGGEERLIMTPGLLPDLELVEMLEVKSGEYWDVQLDFTRVETRESFKRDQSVWLRRRAAYDRPIGEVFVAELQALDETGEAPSVNSMAVASGWKVGQGRNPFEWLFDLQALRDFDHAERALVLPPQGLGAGGGEKLVKGSVVDTRLELEHGILVGSRGGAIRDQLWQLRLLFAWVDRWDEVEEAEVGEGKELDKGSGTWLRQEVVDRLRWRVWKMAGG